jgi:hypothetical protein
MAILLGFLVLKIPKNNKCKKTTLLIWTCPTQLGSQIGPYHFD